MDFSFAEDQVMVRDLARGILEKEVTLERLKRAEADPEWFDRPLWRTLAEAGLLGLAVPESLGGMGFGLLELCCLLQEIGRALAPVPVLPALALGGLALAEFGTAAQKQEWLSPMAAGEAILSAALVDSAAGDSSPRGTTARRDGSRWVLEGRKSFVPAAHLARRLLVPAAVGEGAGTAIFLVDPAVAGVTLARHETSTGEPLCMVELSGVQAGKGDLLGGGAEAGDRMTAWLYDRAVVATCATQVGVAEKALELTAAHVREREQFGVPIGSFQAVQHRSADSYIDIEAMRWVTWRAACKLASGLPAAREAAVAKFWAAEAGARIAAAAQHLHGGIGADIDYPVHRCFLWSKTLELSLGGAARHLARLGRDMARTGPEERA